jgi:hypothetical protein
MKKEEMSIQVATENLERLVRSFGHIDLSPRAELSQSEVDELVYEAVSIKEAVKRVSDVADARVKGIRSLFFAVADKQAGKGAPFVLYSPKHAAKMERQVAHIGGGIDEAKILSGLYRHFGEDEGDTSGKAWTVWCKITDPVQSRVVNEGKLEAELQKSIEHGEGKKHGSTVHYLPIGVVSESRIAPSIQEKFYPKRMTKAEKESHGIG